MHTLQGVATPDRPFTEEEKALVLANLRALEADLMVLEKVGMVRIGNITYEGQDALRYEINR